MAAVSVELLGAGIAPGHHRVLLGDAQVGLPLVLFQVGDKCLYRRCFARMIKCARTQIRHVRRGLSKYGA